jgi:1,4-dihydroxy-2-naphthoyl-CoA hydrolase
MTSPFSPTITPEFLDKVFTQDQLPQFFGITFSQAHQNLILKDLPKLAKEGDFPISCQLTVDDRHLRPGKIMNGGVSLVLIETMGSIAASCVIDIEKENPLGLQVSANHLAVGYPGDVMTATTRAVHIGRTTHIWDVTIVNQNQKLICSGRITVLIAQR